MSTTPAPAYLMGRLLAALESLDALPTTPERAYIKAQEPGWMEQILPRVIAKERNREALAPLLEVLPAFPKRPFRPEADGQFALGYYHQRAALRYGGSISPDEKRAGRPGLPPGIEMQRVPVPLSAEEWDWVKANVSPDERRQRLLDGYAGGPS